MLGDHEISLKDRLLMGVLSAIAGAIVGVVVAFLLMFFLDDFHRSVIGVSAIYFFAIGYLKGHHAGDVAGEALAVVMMMLSDSDKDDDSRGKPSVLLWAGYAVAVTLGIFLLE